jgi:arginine deiminase
MDRRLQPRGPQTRRGHHLRPQPVTEKAFKEFGYKVIGAEKLLRDIENGKISPDKVENTIITIPSNELSRARGGSHCMTCPIEREEI